MSDIFDQFDKAFGGGDAVEQVVNYVAPTGAAPPGSRGRGTPPPPEDDAELLEVEKRLTKASYYKAIVKSGVMEEDGSPEATEINGEARLWARQQMAKLIGQPAAPVQEKTSDFTQAQVDILREVADGILERTGRAKKPEPKVRKMVPQPELKRPAPQQPRQQVKSPVAPKQPPKPAQQQTAQPAAPEVVQAVDLPRRPDRSVSYDDIPTGTPFVDDDGLTYKYVENRDPVSSVNKPRIKMNVTKQTGRSTARPMSKEAMEAMSLIQAQDAIALGAHSNTIFPENNTKQLVLAAAASLKKEE